jgi:Excalibur calcium-binding domain
MPLTRALNALATGYGLETHMTHDRPSKMIAALAIPLILLAGACAGKAAKTSTASTVKLGSSATTAKVGATTVKVTATPAKAAPTTAKASATTAKAGATTATATTVKGATTVAAKKGKVASSLPTVPAPATTVKLGSGPLATLKPVTTVRPAVTVPPVTVAAGSAPAKPEDRNCGDFDNWADSKQFFDTYYPYYGDIAKLDQDGDGIPCESLPGSPK